jgi:Flp pilus assembly protein TadG
METRKLALSRGHSRNEKGSAIVEFGATLAWGLPVLTSILLMGVQLGLYTTANHQLATGAREAARALAIAYGQDNSIANNRTLQNTAVFDTIRKTGFINNTNQFANPVFTTHVNGAVTMTTVTVTVNMTSNQYGCANLGGVLPIPQTISQAETYRCE